MKSIGIGTPGLFSFKKNCVIDGAYQLPGWKNFPFIKKLSTFYKIPIFADNDANLACYGEFRKGAARNKTNVICITLGTGIGGGIIVENSLYRGSFEYSSEIGHMIIDPNGYLCLCGSRGCWEAHASATGLLNEAHEQRLFPQKKYTAQDIFTAFKAGHPIAVKVVQKYIDYLSIGIVNLIRIFDPEIFVIGGGIISSKEILFKPMLHKIKKIQNKRSIQKCSIVPAKLGNKAGIIGSAIFALDSSRTLKK